MNQPLTVSSLCDQFVAIGVEPGMTLIVHSSLSSFGYVSGGAPAVILALESVLGPEGTLAVPTHTADLTDPAKWSDPPVPQALYQTIRDTMPHFYPDLTPARGMGIIPESFRKQNGTLRSNHPFVSWAARGPNAALVTANHSLSMSSGEHSPVARLYDAGARVLLIGVRYDRNTSFHLAEYRNKFAVRKHCRRGAPMPVEGGGSQWVTYDDIYLYDADFLEIGAAFEQTGQVCKRAIGKAECRFFSQRAIVDFAVEWMNANRWLPED
ncbi:MAG: AAC(3) family N-acetyltransferase [Anaerolineae bacterium]|nr:AAC(3) family N-acetyltransferase [Anaerolineae bacterium]